MAEVSKLRTGDTLRIELKVYGFGSESALAHMADGSSVHVQGVALAAAEHIPFKGDRVAQLEKEIERLSTALEPGRASGIVAAMFWEAERLGHSPFSAKHALTFFVEEIERLRWQLQRSKA